MNIQTAPTRFHFIGGFTFAWFVVSVLVLLNNLPESDSAPLNVSSSSSSSFSTINNSSSSNEPSASIITDDAPKPDNDALTHLVKLWQEPLRGHGKSVGVRLIYDQSLVKQNDNNQALTHAQVLYAFEEANRRFRSTSFFSQNLQYEQYGHLVFQVKYDQENVLHNERGWWEQGTLLHRLENSEFTNHMSIYGLNVFFTNYPIIVPSAGNHSTKVDGITYGSLCGAKNLVVVSGYNFRHITDSQFIGTIIRHLAQAWGAQDDEDPITSEKGGSFVMASSDLSHIGPNNLLFSQHSIENISKAIYDGESDHVHKCFMQIGRNTAECGNMVLDEGEECDDGHDSSCCTSTCQLIRWAKCTPFHHLNCNEHCEFKLLGKVCLPSDSRFCLAESRSDGLDGNCAQRMDKLPNGKQCWFNRTVSGVCFQGQCQTVHGNGSDSVVKQDDDQEDNITENNDHETHQTNDNSTQTTDAKPDRNYLLDVFVYISSTLLFAAGIGVIVFYLYHCCCSNGRRQTYAVQNRFQNRVEFSSRSQSFTSTVADSVEDDSISISSKSKFI